jgi:hypothetical protein
MDNFNHIFANSVGVITAEIITLPICTLKTIYQTQLDKTLSIKDTAKKIFKERGLRGYYDAKFSAITSQTLSTVSKYGFYQMIKNYRNTPQNDIFNNSINGCAGGILGSIISHPVDVLKNYNQRGDYNFLKDVKSNPIKTMYKGYSQTIIKNILLYSSIYPIYDFYKSKIPDKSYITAPLTTLTITMYLQPIDYLKVNIMAGNKVKLNIRDLYRGTSLHLMRSIPHFMITMMITEFIYEKLKS